MITSMSSDCNRNLGTWSAGDGDRILNHTNCVASSNYNDTFSDPPPARTPPAVHELYQFQIFDQAPTPGYFLYLDDDNTNVGNARLSVMWEHRDVKVGTGFEELSDGVYSTNVHTGQFRGCGNGDNSEVQMTVQILKQTAWKMLEPDNTVGDSELRPLVGSSRPEFMDGNLAATLRVAEIVRVSALDNVLLGPGAVAVTGLAAGWPVSTATTMRLATKHQLFIP